MARKDLTARRDHTIVLVDKYGRGIGRIDLPNSSTLEARQYAIDVMALHVTPGTVEYDPLVAGVYAAPAD